MRIPSSSTHGACIYRPSRVIFCLLGLLVLSLFFGQNSVVHAQSVQILHVDKPADCDSQPKAGRDKWILVHFKATVDESSRSGKHGEVFQDSKEVGLPIVVQLKENEVIPGWIDGLEGVCAKAKVSMVVPPEIGYGDDITMRFDIELLDVSDTPIDEPSLFDVLDADKDGQISIPEFEAHFKHRKAELDENGKPPMGLFMKDDVNQNAKLNWEEFSGPKGTAPPAVAQAVIDKEQADPELSKHKKGDPLKVKVKLHNDGDSEQEEDDRPGINIPLDIPLDEL